MSFNLEIYPNPVNQGAFATLEFNTDSNEKIHLRMYNTLGKLVKSEKFEVGIGVSHKEIQMPNVPGLYMMRILAEDGSGKTFELLVQ